ncbi:MMPL family transporter [Streptomyces smyrnaeus]|uniref:MMPL family transporter n=1 Tax=Streptomyces smyrnaeus TaxID=1387713 RepID=UPI0033CDA74D
MAALLSKLGQFSFRRRWLVALLWAAVLALAGVLASRAPAPPPDDFSIPDTEVQRAYDLLDESFPSLNADGATARVVFKAPEGKVTAPEIRGAVEETLGKLSEAPQVGQVVDPFTAKSVSKDESTAYAQVSYEVPAAEMSDSAQNSLLETVEEARSADLTVEVGGNAVGGSKEVGHRSEAIGLAMAAVVLVITFGALIAAGLPMLTALLGVAIGICTITALADPLGLSSTTSSLATMLGLAVGIDYALFVVSRYRGELARGRSREDAAGVAVGTAGSAVLFAGLTVIIALAGLGVVGIPVLTKMGLAAAGTVGIAVLIALTLVPALLGIAGKRVGPTQARQLRRRLLRRARATDGVGGTGTDPAGGDPAVRPGLGVRWARFVTRRPLAVLLLCVAGLATLAVPASELEMGLPDDGSKAESTTQHRAYDLLAEGFGPGFNGPLMAVVQAEDGGDARAAANRLATQLGDMDGVATVPPPRVSDKGDTAVLNVIPTSSPDSKETADLVHTLREPDLERDSDARVLVSGTTAMNIDVSQKLSDALVPYLTLVVGLAFLLLIAVFRSLLVPLKAALGFLLSIVAALGAVVAVFQWGWLASFVGVGEPGPVMSIMPIFMIGVVFGLAMDYEVFLVTRMREGYVHGLSPRDAVLSGFEHSARAVTAAALIMISVFAGFIGSSEQMIKTIGFGLATAVVLDAFAVRMTLVPAVLTLLGHRAWRLPRWLDRITPNFDVEGEKLHAKEGPGAAPQPSQEHEDRHKDSRPADDDASASHVGGPQEPVATPSASGSASASPATSRRT